MSHPPRKLTISDVARRAGVSTATVSRAMAQPASVSDATRDRVLAAIRETGYVPNVAARSLRTSRSHTVLAVIPDITNVFFSHVLRGISERLESGGYTLVVAETRGDPAREREHAAMVRAGRVDGLLLLNGRLLPLPPGVAVPTVSLCEAIPGSDLPHVETENRAASRDLVEHLFALGHRRIGYLSGPRRNVLEKERLAGYRDALRRHGLRPEPGLLQQGDFTLASGEAAAARFLAAGPLPDAIFACSDAMAIGLIRAFAAAGVAVPDQVSVAGFDDIEFAAAYTPALTTVHQARARIGAVAADLLLGALSGQDLRGKTVRLPGAVVARQSTRARVSAVLRQA